MKKFDYIYWNALGDNFETKISIFLFNVTSPHCRQLAKKSLENALQESRMNKRLLI